MQVGTNTHSISFSNSEIDNLAAMRLAQEPWRWRKAILASKMTAGAKVAAFAVAEFVNRKSGKCFASYQTIAETCGMTERGVRAAVAALKAAGLLRVVQRGCKQTNLIYLALPVTVMDAGSDRHGCVGVTGTTMPPNLREEPLREDNLTDRPSLELPVEATAEIHAFDEKARKPEIPIETADSPIRRGSSDHAAYCWITAAAVEMLGVEPKLPDGRFLDQIIWETIPADRRAIMVQRNRRGILMRSEVAEVVRGLGLAQAHQRAA